METRSTEKTTIALASSETAANDIVLESGLAANLATLISDYGSEQHAFPIEIKLPRMSCSRCQHTFPVGFYCIECGYVPTGQEN